MYFELKILKSHGKASSFSQINGISKDFSELNLYLKKNILAIYGSDFGNKPILVPCVSNSLVNKSVGLSSCRTIEPSDYRIVGISSCRTTKFSNYRVVGLSSSRIIQLTVVNIVLSEYRIFELPSCRTIELSDYQTVGL